MKRLSLILMCVAGIVLFAGCGNNSGNKSDKNDKNDGKKLSAAEKAEQIKLLTAQMKEAAKLLEFEHAAYLRDKIAELKGEK